jgi:hypothetical protein
MKKWGNSKIKQVLKIYPLYDKIKVNLRIGAERMKNFSC